MVGGSVGAMLSGQDSTDSGEAQLARPGGVTAELEGCELERGCEVAAVRPGLSQLQV